MTDFESLANTLSGEPLLGPRQAALVDALTERLRYGPAMSPQDAGASRWLQAVLGLAAVAR